mmetsp:Transcript_18907/g.27990  ORF Transcript_18907/g.27990 Transcript_18907/m.27990 type:complete len:213 (-) Transcript_18907:61-699(-)
MPNSVIPTGSTFTLLFGSGQSAPMISFIVTHDTCSPRFWSRRGHSRNRMCVGHRWRSRAPAHALRSTAPFGTSLFLSSPFPSSSAAWRFVTSSMMSLPRSVSTSMRRIIIVVLPIGPISTLIRFRRETAPMMAIIVSKMTRPAFFTRRFPRPRSSVTSTFFIIIMATRTRLRSRAMAGAFSPSITARFARTAGRRMPGIHSGDILSRENQAG